MFTSAEAVLLATFCEKNEAFEIAEPVMLDANDFSGEFSTDRFAVPWLGMRRFRTWHGPHWRRRNLTWIPPETGDAPDDLSEVGL